MLQRPQIVARNFLDDKLWNVPEHLRGQSVRDFRELLQVFPRTPLFFSPNRLSQFRNWHFPFSAFVQRSRLDYNGFIYVAYWCPDEARIRIDSPLRLTEIANGVLLRSYECRQCRSIIGRDVYSEGR